MSKYVPDVKTQRWVIISQARTRRPNEKKEESEKSTKEFKCPFCAGNEYMTPPEVYRIGGGEKDKPGWQVRVVPNKFPITDTHEVIIHSPDDRIPLEKMSPEQVNRVIRTYRDRYLAHDSDGHVLIFCNQGYKAGASLKHPHSQLVVVPRQINLDSLTLEPIANVVSEGERYITYCPEFSQWPYEVWITPKEKGHKFGDLRDDEIPFLSQDLISALRKIDTALSDVSEGLKKADECFVYNYYIYHGTNWFIRIIPRAISRAGFELGTGLNVNIVDPTDAAEKLRSIV